jgi:cell wall-associated NlpC family hydrolase
MSADLMRAAIVAEAKTWLGTPYKSVGRIKGVGISCAMLVYQVVRAVRIIPEGAAEPKWYSGQVHLNSTEDRMIDCLVAYGGREIAEAAIQPGDIVFYKTGLSFGHIAIIVDWPETVIHAIPKNGCSYAHGTHEGMLSGKLRRYFTLIGDE